MLVGTRHEREKSAVKSDCDSVAPVAAAEAPALTDMVMEALGLATEVRGHLLGICGPCRVAGCWTASVVASFCWG